jgi:hypothetical protein
MQSLEKRESHKIHQESHVLFLWENLSWIMWGLQEHILA